MFVSDNTYKRWIRAFSWATHQINSTSSPQKGLMGLCVPLLRGLHFSLFKIRLFNRSQTSEITLFSSDLWQGSCCSLQHPSLSKSNHTSLLFPSPCPVGFHSTSHHLWSPTHNVFYSFYLYMPFPSHFRQLFHHTVLHKDQAVLNRYLNFSFRVSVMRHWALTVSRAKRIHLLWVKWTI